MSRNRSHGVGWWILVGWWWYLGFAWWVSILRRGVKRGQVVTVAFCDLAEPPPDGPGGGYTYTWPFRAEPSIGDRVFVPGNDPHPAPAVVISLRAAPSSRGLELKPVARLATGREIAAAQRRRAADLAAWLAMARHAAGLPTSGQVRRTPPAGYPKIPPANGTASPDAADSHGRTWWRAYKCAEEQGWPEHETAAVRAIARRWFAIRDETADTDV